MWRHVVLQWINTVSSGSLTRQTYRYVTACAVCNCLVCNSMCENTISHIHEKVQVHRIHRNEDLSLRMILISR